MMMINFIWKIRAGAGRYICQMACLINHFFVASSDVHATITKFLSSPWSILTLSFTPTHRFIKSEIVEKQTAPLHLFQISPEDLKGSLNYFVRHNKLLNCFPLKGHMWHKDFIDSFTSWKYVTRRQVWLCREEKSYSSLLTSQAIDQNRRINVIFANNRLQYCAEKLFLKSFPRLVSRWRSKRTDC